MYRLSMSILIGLMMIGLYSMVKEVVQDNDASVDVNTLFRFKPTVIHKDCGSYDTHYDPRSNTIVICNELTRDVSMYTSNPDAVNTMIWYHEYGHWYYNHKIPSIDKEYEADNYSFIRLKKEGYSIEACEFWENLCNDGIGNDALHPDSCIRWQNCINVLN